MSSHLLHVGVRQAILGLVSRGAIPDRDIVRSLSVSFGSEEVFSVLSTLEQEGVLHRDRYGFLRRSATV